MSRSSVITYFFLIATIGYIALFINSKYWGNTTASSYDVGIEQDVYFYPEGWKYLPISTSNYLWRNTTENTTIYREEIIDNMRNFTEAEWVHGTWHWLIERYVPEIGFNGFIDAISQGIENENLEVPVNILHSLGMIIAQSADPNFVVQITARPDLQKSPFYGALSYLVASFPSINNQKKLIDFIEHKLCYFEEYPNMRQLWLSCAHGVGQGLGNYFLPSRMEHSLAICALHYDHDFILACATGVSMTVVHEFDDAKLSPCDLVKFPVTCFRYKTQLYNQTNEDGTLVSNVCFQEPKMNDYHIRGCLFGEGYHKAVGDADVVFLCEDYIPNNTSVVTLSEQLAWKQYACCLDGVWMKTRIHEIERAEEYCNLWADTPVFKYCRERQSSFLEADAHAEAIWNWELFEFM